MAALVLDVHTGAYTGVVPKGVEVIVAPIQTELWQVA